MKHRLNIIAGVTAAVICLILLSLAQEMNRRWQVQREVQLLEKEAMSLKQEVIELEHLNQYFQTDDYQERLAREKLNYRAPQEQVVLIPEEDSGEPTVVERRVQEKEIPNPLTWWNKFFGERQI